MLNICMIDILSKHYNFKKKIKQYITQSLCLSYGQLMISLHLVITKLKPIIYV